MKKKGDLDILAVSDFRANTIWFKKYCFWEESLIVMVLELWALCIKMYFSSTLDERTEGDGEIDEVEEDKEASGYMYVTKKE